MTIKAPSLNKPPEPLRHPGEILLGEILESEGYHTRSMGLVVSLARATPSCAKTRPTADLSVKLAHRRRRRRKSPPQESHNQDDGAASPFSQPVEQRLALRQALAMDLLPRPLTFFLLLFSGWVT